MDVEEVPSLSPLRLFIALALPERPQNEAFATGPHGILNDRIALLVC